MFSLQMRVAPISLERTDPVSLQFLGVPLPRDCVCGNEGVSHVKNMQECLEMRHSIVKTLFLLQKRFY